jgi:hypothetical protein
LEDHVTTIFRTEEQANNKPECKACFILVSGLLYNLEDGGNVIL